MTAARGPSSDPGDSLQVVAVAASAGGVEALKGFVRGLPAGLPATVLVALHLPSAARSVLADILTRHCAMRVDVAEHGRPLEPGRVVVAPPDSHLLVRDGTVLLGHGPRENGHRPSHDAMLRSLAVAFGPRATGVVLTGLLDDGAAGLGAVHRYGGTCLVQDPDTADYASMPRAALTAVPSARCLSLSDLPAEVVRVVNDPSRTSVPPPVVSQDLRDLDLAEIRSAEHGSPTLSDGSTPGTPSPFSCPDCSGVLNHVPDERVLRFRCRTGHAWTSDSLAMQQEEQVEEALWVALRVLEERAAFSRQLSEQAAEGPAQWAAAHHTRRADEADRSAALVRRVLQDELAAVDRPVAAAGS